MLYLDTLETVAISIYSSLMYYVSFSQLQYT